MIYTIIKSHEIIFIILNVTLIIKGNDVVNQDIEKMIEMAGCPFVSIHQKLVRNVCLLPAYQINEAPMGLNNHTYVKIDLHRVSILEIDEQKNKLSLHISQALQWPEPRIRANFSTVLDDRPSIKLSPEDFLKIWHPDLDMDTNNLLKWKSLYEPRLFKHIVISGQENGNSDFLLLRGWKEWRATVICKFDFALYPFDTQQCIFLQEADDTSLTRFFYVFKNTTALEQNAGGFKIVINPIGAFVTGKELFGLQSQASDKIGFNITFTRIVKPHLCQYYFPCMAIVIVSQISFMIPLTSIPGRVALVTTQFLTLTNIFIHQMVGIFCHLENGSLNFKHKRFD